jgi:hypothetical protein
MHAAVMTRVETATYDQFARMIDKGMDEPIDDLV